MPNLSSVKRVILPCLNLIFLISACLPSDVNAVQSAASSPTPTLLPATATPSQTSILPTLTAEPSPTTTPTAAPTPTHSKTTVVPQNENTRVILMAVGDIMLGRTIGDLITTEGAEAPFQYTADVLKSADITIGNLECPITSTGMAADKTYTFMAPPAAAESLSFAGFDLVSLANNHVLDYGITGLQSTLDHLSAEGILSAGAGIDAANAYAPVYVESQGLLLAFLAYVDVPTTDYDYKAWTAGENKPGVAWVNPDRMAADIQEAKTKADLVIILMHNGYEIVQKVSEDQQIQARLAIESGADLVIGSHPHVLQRVETYQEGLIVYSMGNFVFDNFLFPPNYSAILSVELSKDGVESYTLIDVIIQLNGVPQIMPYH